MKVQGTRYPEAFPLPRIETERIAQSLVKLFSRVGVARIILSDQDCNFTSTLLKQFHEMLCVKGITTSPNRHQSNGKCERYNGTLKKVLKKLCITYEKDWDEMLPYALFAYRETPHEETIFSPFKLLYGWPVSEPTEMLKLAMTGEEDVEKYVMEHVINVRERLSEIRDIVGENHTAKTKAWYNRNTGKRYFSPGDNVVVLLPTESSKMRATCKGSFRSQEIIRCEISSKCRGTPRFSYLSYQLAEEI
jgi:transposase InsO family protein